MNIVNFLSLVTDHSSIVEVRKLLLFKKSKNSYSFMYPPLPLTRNKNRTDETQHNLNNYASEL